MLINRFPVKNVFFAKFMPISAAMAFDNTGAPYQVGAILTDGIFNQTLYEAYSPLYLPTTFIISYGAQFASLSAIVVHVFRKLLFIDITSSCYLPIL